MRKKLSVFLFSIFVLQSYGQNNWQQRASFAGSPRTAPFYFTAAGFGFVGTGEDSNFVLQNDLWRYDISTDSWFQKSSFPGGARKWATAFGITNIGYAGTGLSDTSLMKDFWSYDALADTWARIQDLGEFSNPTTLPRRDASSATWLGTGYVICGYDGSMGFNKQLFNLDPNADTMWVKKKNFTNVTDQTLLGRRWGTSFSLLNKVYYGTGYSSSNDTKKDIWQYDPIRDLWTQMADLPGDNRANAVAFTAYDKGYIGGGSNENMTRDFYRYDPASNQWTYVCDYPLRAANMVSFTINNRVFVGLGNDSLGKPLIDFYEFIPDSTIGFNDATNRTLVKVYPTVVTDFFIIDTEQRPDKNYSVTLFDTQGKKVDELSLTSSRQKIERKENYHGLIFYGIRLAGKEVSSGKLFFD